MKILQTTTASILGFALMAGMASAGSSFTFKETGSAEGEFKLNFTEISKRTDSKGASFEYIGGAGSEGNLKANADDYSKVTIAAKQSAVGNGNAFSDTALGNSARVKYAAESYGVNTATGYSERFGNNPAKASYDGIALAGGAGEVSTGLSTAVKKEYSLSGDGSGSYKLKQNQSVSGNLAP